MIEQSYPSILLEEAVSQLAKLPGVGRKTALRLVLHILRQKPDYALSLSESIQALRTQVRYCQHCYNISDTEICTICGNPQRDHTIVCVVENIREMMAVEATRQFAGVYHVLGGVISPMDGIGPSDLEIESLIERVSKGEVKEVVLALSTTMEGDTTNFFIYRKLAPYNVQVTTLSRGVSVGGELQYADELTLARSILNRTPFEQAFKNT